MKVLHQLIVQLHENRIRFHRKCVFNPHLVSKTLRKLKRCLVGVLRVSQPDIERPFRVPAIYLVAPAGALSAILLMLGLPGDTWLRLGVWLILGLVIYFCYGMRHSRVANETA